METTPLIRPSFSPGALRSFRQCVSIAPEMVVRVRTTSDGTILSVASAADPAPLAARVAVLEGERERWRQERDTLLRRVALLERDRRLTYRVALVR